MLIDKFNPKLKATPQQKRQMTISGQQEWYRKIAQPQWATDHDRRLRLAKAKAKALKLKLELMKI